MNTDNLIDVICRDNSMGDNKKLFTVGQTYKGIMSIDKNGNIYYTIYQVKKGKDNDND